MLLKINNQWCMTRVNAYKRYKYTIMGFEILLKYLEE